MITKDECIKQLLALFDKNVSIDKLDNAANSVLKNKKIILYGGGNGAATFITFVVKQYGYNVSAIIDEKITEEKSWMNYPAYSPRRYLPTTEEKENSVVVITVGNKAAKSEIYQSMSRKGFKKILFATDVIEYHLHYTPKEYKRSSHDFFHGQKQNITDCYNLLGDEKSKMIYNAFLGTYRYKKILPIPNQMPKFQYFPEDLKLNKGYSRVINCGSFRGDTIEQLNLQHGKNSAIACFEPDSQNFKCLTDYLMSEPDRLSSSVIAFPCGVFNDEEQLKFNSALTNSAIKYDGNAIIQCVALDHVLPNFKPTFISMDIEGAEPDALRGAENLIKKNSPDLAICVYHAPNHIWDIPIYLNKLGVKYKYYLRNYTGYTSETVLYATS